MGGCQFSDVSKKIKIVIYHYIIANTSVLSYLSACIYILSPIECLKCTWQYKITHECGTLVKKGGGEKVQETLCTSMPKYVLWTCDWMYIMPIMSMIS